MMSQAPLSNRPAEVTSISPHLEEQTGQVRTIDLYRCFMPAAFSFYI